MQKLTSITLISALSLAMVACGNQKPEEANPNVKNVKEQAASMEKEAGMNHNHEGHDKDEQMAETSKPVVMTDSGVGIINPYAKPTHPGQKVSVAYFTITNPTDKDIEVTSISSNVAKITEMHSMEMQDSKMVMRQLEKVIIPAGGEFVMNEGGNHVMLIELKEPLAEGDEVILNLDLSNGEKLEVTTKASNVEENGMEMDHSNHEMHDSEQEQNKQEAHQHDEHTHDKKKSD